MNRKIAADDFAARTARSELLAPARLIFWSPGFLFTWVFDGILQMARYPIGIYPAWLRLVLTWIVPVRAMATVPADVFRGDLRDVGGECRLCGCVVCGGVTSVRVRDSAL